MLYYISSILRHLWFLLQNSPFNLIVAITFLLSSLVILLRKKVTPFLEFLKNSSVIYMTVVILTYHFILARGGDYDGVRIITNFTLHYLIPLLVFINWIVFESKRKYSFKFVFYWMIYPLFYTVFSVVRGMFDGFYPYFFLNPNGEIPVGVGSYMNVFLFMVAFSIVFMILGMLLIILNRVVLYVQNKGMSTKDNFSKTNSL